MKFKGRLSKVQDHLQILWTLGRDSFLALLLEFRERSSLTVVSLVMVSSHGRKHRKVERGWLAVPALSAHSINTPACLFKQSMSLVTVYGWMWP